MSNLFFRSLPRLLLAGLAVALVACGGPTPSTAPPSASPTPTTPAGSVDPGGVAVAAPLAAAAVLSADPRFVLGFMPFNPALAQERWYEMTNEGSVWDVSVSVGWGDCSIDCPHRHTWHYRVGSDGTAVFGDEAGEGLPPDVLPTPGANSIAEVHLMTATTCSNTGSCAPGLPGVSFKLTRFDTKNDFQLDTDSTGGRHSSLPAGVYIMTTVSRPDGGPLPAPFALSLAPGLDNIITVPLPAATASDSATPAASPTP